MADEQKPEPAPPAKPTPAAKAAPAARTARPAPAAPNPALAGRTTSAAAKPAPARRAKPAGADDTSPLMPRRAWLGLSWGAFTAATAGCLAATGRFMFPNVLNEPPQQFAIGFPEDYARRGRRAVQGPLRGLDRADRHSTSACTRRPGFYALFSVCTHLGCTPNWLSAENKFKCPCHGSGFRPTGVNFEGPAPRPLERTRIVLAEDGQILVDKSRKFQSELGQWSGSRVVPRGVDDDMAQTETINRKEAAARPRLELADRDADLDVDLPARRPDQRPQPRAGHAVERVPAPASGHA